MCYVLNLLLKVYSKGINEDVFKDLVIRMFITELFVRKIKVRNSLRAERLSKL